MCGIFGVYSEKPIKIVPILHDGLIMLQHRGQEGAGVVLSDKDHPIRDFYERRIAPEGNSVKHFFNKFGYADQNFYLGVGHTRYSTAGSVEKIENIQPLLASTKFGMMAVVHNGNLPYASKMRKDLEADGESFSSDSDTEVILKFIARSKKDNIVDAIIESLERVQGAYSVIFVTKDEMIAARDPYGFRPLSLSVFDYGNMIASETCAFDAIEKIYNVKFLRDIEPGELVVLGKKGLESISPFRKVQITQCIFELIYFARPDSRVFGIDTSEFRMNLGYLHTKEHPIRVDEIVAIPDSANFFGDGHAQGLGVPHRRALVRNHYTGRTFIEPIVSERRRNIRLKLNPIPRLITGYDISVDDDSIVRGNTARKIIRMLRGCQPKSITFSVSCPPIISYCPYGIDIKKNDELIASGRTIEEICRLIEADDLHYLSLKSLKKLGGPNFCYGCFDSHYPL